MTDMNIVDGEQLNPSNPSELADIQRRSHVFPPSRTIWRKFMAADAAASSVSEWDFKDADTKSLTHCFHAYPAMMIPQIAGRLIDLYGKKARLLLDPYCGTGTSMVEANVRGINAKGSDLNPLARLIASAKTCKLPARRVASHIQRMRSELLACGLGALPSTVALAFPNINFWFPPEVQKKLAAIKSCIDQIEDDGINNFMLVVFSETVRECSYTRNGEFKLYRMAEPKRQAFAPDVCGIFAAKMERNHTGLQAYAQAAKTNAHTQVFDFNSTDEIPAIAATFESVDMVVTSPPYGDSSTTVAYGQFSRLANEWLGFENAAAIDRRLMGGGKSKELLPLGDASLDEAVGKIEAVNPKRALQVCGFYRDYRRSIDHVAATIKPGGFACYVVGNRKVKGVVLPTDRATEAYFKANGFTRERVFIRNIPNKRMPARNSPSNLPGMTDNTICHEHIVVMRKRK